MLIDGLHGARWLPVKAVYWLAWIVAANVAAAGIAVLVWLTVSLVRGHF